MNVGILGRVSNSLISYLSLAYLDMISHHDIDTGHLDVGLRSRSHGLGGLMAIL